LGQSSRDTLVFGFTQPAIVLSGGIKDMDPLVEEPQGPQRAIHPFCHHRQNFISRSTRGWHIIFNKLVVGDPSGIAAIRTIKGWLFLIKTEKSADQLLEFLASAEDYLQSLRNSEGFKNPEGLEGGVSGICKAVYTGIGGQKI
jgi:hypothetical protein